MTTPTAALTTLVYNLVIPQNADWPGVTFPILNANGSVYDLTGCTARGEIRPSPGSNELYYAWSTSPTTGQGLITLDTTAHTLNIRVLAAESALWTFTSASYDILITNPAAATGFKISRVVMGSVTVAREVTI